MNAEIITIGDELLIGQVIDSNSAFIGKQLTQVGIEVNRIKTIKDDAQEIKDALDAAAYADVVLITGGLGPTKDDITKNVFCEYFDDHLVENSQVLAHIKNLFKHIDEPILAENLSQAQVPSKAEILPNPFGTAPGMWFERNKTVYVSMPGVPYEMKAILIEEVIPRFVEKYKRPYILHKTVLTYGVGESNLAKKIEKWESKLPVNARLAYLPSPGQVRLRLTFRGKNRPELQTAMANELQKLEQLIGDVIGGYEGEGSLLEEIGNQLKTLKKTVATAESCTGGEIAAMITRTPGASTYFKAGIVAYETFMKTELLGVSKDSIDKFSVVSGQVAKEMAEGARRKLKTDFSIATTGNAGPAKGDSDAEVGTVFIAVADHNGTEVREFHFGNSREKVVRKSVMKALEMLKYRLALKKESR